MIKGTNTGTNNPPVQSKGDRNGKGFIPPRAGPIPNPAPRNPPVREVPYHGKDRVK